MLYPCRSCWIRPVRDTLQVPDSKRGEVAKRSTAAVLKTARQLYHWPLARGGCAHDARTTFVAESTTAMTVEFGRVGGSRS